MKSNIAIQEKQGCIKKEVKYVCMSSTTMKESRALFRFKKLMQKSILIITFLI